MPPDETRDRVMAYWLELADDAMASARSEHQAGRNRFAINRCYYACFCAAGAVLLREGKTYAGDVALRHAVHKELVHSGRISQSLGAVYDDLVSSSRKADYDPSAHISPDDALEAMRRAAEFVAAMKRLTAQ